MRDNGGGGIRVAVRPLYGDHDEGTGNMTTPTTELTGAALLREAARLMRERAERATPGPWFFADEQDEDGSYYVGDTILAPSPRADVERGADEVMELGSLWPPANTRLAASWHPAVALAVADWLEREANFAVTIDADTRATNTWCADALAVARAYLGLS